VKLIHGTALVPGIGCLRCRHRGAIRVDIGLPHAEPRENMSRHVHGMRTRRGDLTVAAGGRQSTGRERRRVAGVNDVVHDPRMVGMILEQGGQHRHGSVFLRQAGVIRRLGRQQRQGVERGRIEVVGVAFI